MIPQNEPHYPYASYKIDYVLLDFTPTFRSKKIFEYMATRRPIITSGLPSLREILNEDNSILVRPDDDSALADGIKLVMSDNVLAVRISQKAFEDVKKYTWQERVGQIMRFIK